MTADAGPVARSRRWASRAPQPVPDGARDDAAQRAARGRRAAPGRPADRAAAAGAVRRAGPRAAAASTPPAARVLSGAVLLGTGAHDQTGIAELLQSHGAELSVSTDPDRLLFATTLLAGRAGAGPRACSPSCSPTPTYPDDRVEGERDRVAERIAIARSQPGVIARTALAARRYGDHPYAIQLPDAELVAAVRRRRAAPPAPRARAARRQQPRAGRRPRPAARDRRRRRRRSPAWVGDRARRARRRRPRSCGRRAIELVDRPGRRAVQPPARRPARRGRTDPDLAAVRLANMIFGGYFSSRLVENIRERRGYTYSPRSSVDHQAAGSSFLVEADVATEVTGPALLETWYELGRMALTPVTEAELDGARRYILGSMALSTATHAGPGQHAVRADRRGPAGRTGSPSTSRRSAAVTVEEVQDVSLRYLAADRADRRRRRRRRSDRRAAAGPGAGQRHAGPDPA